MKYSILTKLADHLFSEGYRTDAGLTHGSAQWAVLIFEAANGLSKTCKNFAEIFYNHKENAALEAIGLGAKHAYGQDKDQNPVLFLYAEGVGIASFHCISFKKTASFKSPEWSELKRRDYAIFALNKPELRAFLEAFTGIAGNTSGLTLEEAQNHLNTLAS